MMIKQEKVSKILEILTPLYAPIDNQLRDHFEKSFACLLSTSIYDTTGQTVEINKTKD